MNPADSTGSGSPTRTHEPLGDRQWTGFAMITAGDGRHYEARGAGCVRRWRRLGDHAELRVLTDDEIAALGPVRECVPITLDRPPLWARLWVEHSSGPASAEDLAAELIAAARQARLPADGVDRFFANLRRSDHPKWRTVAREAGDE